MKERINNCPVDLDRCKRDELLAMANVLAEQILQKEEELNRVLQKLSNLNELAVMGDIDLVKE